MVLLSLHELTAAQIAELLECHPGTARRWIARFNDEGLAGLADRPRSGRPRLGGRRLTRRIAALLARPGPWTLPRIRRCLGWPQVSVRTLYRRVRLVAIWRRPKLTAAATLTMTTTMTTSSPESSPGCWNCPARRWCWRRMRRT
jgi:transposase